MHTTSKTIGTPYVMVMSNYALSVHFQDPEKFDKCAKDCVKEWEQRIYTQTSDDPHYIR